MRIRLCLSSFLLLIVFAVFFSFSASAETYYTVSYNANGGTGAPESQTKTQGQSLTLYTVTPTRAPEDTGNKYTVTLDPNGGSILINTSPARVTWTARVMKNYTFQNWNTNSFGIGTSYMPGAIYTPDADVTLYAQWSSRVSTETVMLPTPRRSGYTFKGYAESREDVSGVISSYTPTKDITLYAIWEEGASGTWGSLRWRLDSTGTLTVSGKGEMAAFSSGSTEAWRTHKDSIKTVVIENGLTNIGSYSFRGCSSITSVSIPDSVTSIYSNAFYNCSCLADVYYEGSKMQWILISISFNNDSFNSAVKHYAKTSIGGTWGGLNWSLDEEGLLTVSGNGAIDDFSLSSTSAWRSYHGSIKSVVFQGQITNIGSYAFYNCDLTSAMIPDGVNSIGDYAFYYCGFLTSLAIPNSVTNIGSNAFSWCDHLTSVTIPGSVTGIGENAFSACSNLTSVTIQEGVTSIGAGAFSICKRLASVKIPDSVASISRSTFYACSSLTSVTIPETVTNIGSSAFYQCSSLTSVTIPDSVTSIDWYAFYDCSSLTSVTIPDSVTSIGSYAFQKCSGLTSATIGKSVTRIGDSAFQYCDGMTDVYYEGTQSQWDSISVGRNNNGLIEATRHYFLRISFNTNGGSTIETQIVNPGNRAVQPADPAKDGYMFVGWYIDKDFTTEFDFVTPITESITLYAEWFGPDLILPAALTAIGEESFAGGAFSYVKLSEDTVTIGPRAFANCPNLIFIYIPEATTDIDPQAFGDIQSLTIFGKSGSVADDYALEHGYRFVDYP